MIDIKSFDGYGNLSKRKYFFNVFQCVPSYAELEIPLKQTQKNMEAVMQKLNADGKMELIFKEWEISQNQNAPLEADFVNEYFFKSTDKKLCVYVLLGSCDLEIDCYYDHNDKDAEEWILKTFREIRNELGKPISPVFKVLSRRSGGFYTEEINIDKFDTNVATHYNDDFNEIDTIISSSIEKDESGLILLHGVPGTGKTTYIKSLMSKHPENSFIFIPNDFVNELLQPDFISFLISHKNSVLVIEDAEKVLVSRENENRNSVVSTILQLTDGLFSDYLNIKIVCTFNTNIDNIDKALLRKGRVIAFYEFKELEAKKADALLAELGIEAANKKMSVADIFNFDSKDFSKKKSAKTIGFGG